MQVAVSSVKRGSNEKPSSVKKTTAWPWRPPVVGVVEMVAV
jgi:hypothetical protein